MARCLWRLDEVAEISSCVVQATRLKEYPNYHNCADEVMAGKPSIRAEAQFVNKVQTHYLMNGFFFQRATTTMLSCVYSNTGPGSGKEGGGGQNV